MTVPQWRNRRCHEYRARHYWKIQIMSLRAVPEGAGSSTRTLFNSRMWLTGHINLEQQRRIWDGRSSCRTGWLRDAERACEQTRMAAESHMLWNCNSERRPRIRRPRPAQPRLARGSTVSALRAGRVGSRWAWRTRTGPLCYWSLITARLLCYRRYSRFIDWRSGE